MHTAKSGRLTTKSSTCTVHYLMSKGLENVSSKLQRLLNKTKVLHTAFSVETRLAEELILQ